MKNNKLKIMLFISISSMFITACASKAKNSDINNLDENNIELENQIEKSNELENSSIENKITSDISDENYSFEDLDITKNNESVSTIENIEIISNQQDSNIEIEESDNNETDMDLFDTIPAENITNTIEENEETLEENSNLEIVENENSEETVNNENELAQVSIESDSDEQENSEIQDSTSIVTTNFDAMDIENDSENSLEEANSNASDLDDKTYEVVVESTDDSDVLEITDEEDIKVKKTIIKPSRSVTMKKNEYLEIKYPGSGWVFAGLTDGTRDIRSAGRKLGGNDTIYTVQAISSGKKILHFYKEDNLTGTFIDDYLEVLISNEKGDSQTRIRAPDYKKELNKNQ